MLPVHVSWPPAYALRGALRFVIVISSSWLARGPRVKFAGETATPRPEPEKAKLYVSVRHPTFVTVRVTVWEPARAPIATEATLKSLGSRTGIPAPVQTLVGSCVPQRKPSQSFHRESKTRPGSAALFGRTCPAPCRKITSGFVFGPSRTSDAVVMSADLIIIGDQSGWRSMRSAARPATWGLDIDVPL